MNIANSSPKDDIINIRVYFLLDFPLCLNKVVIIKHVQLSFLPQGSHGCDLLVWYIFLWPGRPLIFVPPPPPIPATPDASDGAWPLCWTR